VAAIARLGVLGGTFDPIHLGHLLMAQTALEGLGLDRVLFLPAGTPPHKRKVEHLDVEKRLELTRAAVADDPRFLVSTVDVERPGPHYSVDTMALLAEQYRIGPDSIYFIIGSDSLKQLHTWRRPGELARRCMLAVIERPGWPTDLEAVAARVPETERRVVTVTMPLVGISSTILRGMVARGQSVRYWVPPAVEAIICERGLYRQPQPETGGNAS